MSPKEWKELKDLLIARGFTVETKGRQKKEYIASTDYMVLNILRGGIGHTGSAIEMYIYTPDLDEIVLKDIYRTIQDLLKIVDAYMSDYLEFGNII